MYGQCPFCKSHTPVGAVICPHCTRDMRDLHAVFGPPPSPSERESLAKVEVRQFFGGAGLVLGFGAAYYFGLSWWLIGVITVVGTIIGDKIGYWLTGSEV